MAKYLLLKHYGGGPAPAVDWPMDQWTPDEVDAHVQFMRRGKTRLHRDSRQIRVSTRAGT